jgi:hypothetical protein
VGKSADGRYDPIFSKTALPTDNVEITDEMYIVKEPIKPPSLGPETIVITPNLMTLKSGGEFQFTARVLDAQGKEMPEAKVEWSASGGTINELGVFWAGSEIGTFRITASIGKVQGSATIAIVQEVRKPVRLEVHPSETRMTPGKTQSFTALGFDQAGQEVSLSQVDWEAMGGVIDKDGLFRGGQDEGTFVITAKAGDLKGTSKVIIRRVKAHWSGEVPHQRWSQLYNKVLMKHVVGNKLKLTIDLDLSEITDEDIEQMRIALKELGLDDDVKIT